MIKVAKTISCYSSGLNFIIVSSRYQYGLNKGTLQL